jgi:cytochrome c-type biogenesis protein CcmE
MKQGKLVFAGVLALVCTVVGIAAMVGSTTSTVSFKEAVNKGAERVELYGKLDKRSIRALRGANLVAFDLVEEKTGTRLEVLYDNPTTGLPANFPAASHAKATGTYDRVKNTLVADLVMTKCPSKYKEENPDAATQEAMKRWRESTGAKSASAQ